MARNLKIAAAQLGAAQSRRHARGRGRAPGRAAARGPRARREVRRLSRARAHHLLPALLDGGPGRGRPAVLRADDAESRDVQPLFDWRATLRHRLLPRLCRADARRRAARGASTPRSWSGPTARSSASTARSTCRATPSTSRRPRSSTSRRSTSRSATSASASGSSWTPSPGMLICNDRRWPEAFRVLALQGAEIVALGFNTPTENLHYPEPPALRVHHHLIMAQSMAFQNATWLVRDRQVRLRGRLPHVRPLGDRRADRRDRRQERRPRRTR